MFYVHVICGYLTVLMGITVLAYKSIKHPTETTRGSRLAIAAALLYTGAMFCGITLAALCCETVFSSDYTLSALTPFAVLGIPVFDTAFAIERRLSSGTGVFVGDKKHVHHRLSGRYGHFLAVVLLYAAAILLAGVALIINAPGGEIVGSLLLALCLAYAIVRFGVYKG